MTQEQAFLDWCEKHSIKFSLRKGRKDDKTYNINPDGTATILVQGVELKMNPMQDSNAIHIYFDSDGKWYGGTNTIWNTDLPWHGHSHKPI